ncbi:hypothetical protein [Arthrobacter sp. H14]|uniref:hypothetical protein n=1 Tax=Arthrobacter sp. H14 TaxID=1312959 RepID=UPI00047C37F6|nr:hypothetical protein [Arthrobacter sp. H14]
MTTAYVLNIGPSDNGSIHSANADPEEELHSSWGEAKAAAEQYAGCTLFWEEDKGSLERSEARRQTENHDLFYLLDLEQRL